jgi:uncharacterized membrane protein YeaQ/YmgE (transglycosylase-associated protein family)
MFSLLGTAIIVLVVGAIAKLLMPGKDPGGWIITMLLGLAGSFVAGYLGRMIGKSPTSRLSAPPPATNGTIPTCSSTATALPNRLASRALPPPQTDLSFRSRYNVGVLVLA